MKKLNRKGFTLVELLAVIIILAIVVGIAIPSVTSVINNSKKKGFETAMESAAGYLTKQAQLMSIDMGSLDTEFDSLDGADDNSMTDGTYSVAASTHANLWSKLGLKVANISEFSITVTAGEVCVTVAQIPTAGEYYTTSAWTSSGATATPITGSIRTSFGSGC